MKPIRVIAAMVCCAIFAGALSAKDAPATAPGQPLRLLEGVQSIAAPGLPGTVCAFGDGAVVIAAFAEGSRGVRLPVIAVATYGTGRVVIFGHTGFLDPEALKAADTRRLMTNLLDWAAPHPVGAAIRVGSAGNLTIAKALESPHTRSIALGTDWQKKLGDVDVLMIDAATLKPEDVQPLGDYVHRGGAVFMSETGWGWEQLHPGRSLRDHPANRLLAPMGLAFASESVRAGNDGAAKVEDANDPLFHAIGALAFLADSSRRGDGKEAAPKQAQASATLLSASRVAPSDSAFMLKLAGLRRDAKDVVPTQKSPLRTTNGLGRVLLDSEFEHWQDRPPEMQKAYAGADQFPGAVPADAPRVTKTIHVDTAVPRWHSTGLYAAPGKIVTVSVPADLKMKGLSIRIGAHTDILPGTDNWSRPPDISGSWPIKSPRMRVASPFGGLLYIDVGRGAENRGALDVTIEGGVEAPLYVLGTTSAKEWKDRVRLLPAPWAELASGKLILTCPSAVVRELDDPEALMRHWDRVLDADATLVGRPLARSSPERIVADVQISAGYMHSGYPIMTHLDVTHAMVDLHALHTIDGGWGFYHELGHNHQRSDWTFPGTTEVTVNLFSMYVLETVCGLSPEEVTRRAVTDDGHPDRIKQYLAHPDFAVWSAEPFLALDMYAQLRLAFGWEPYKKVLAEYRDLPDDQRPRKPIDQHDQWMVRMSKAVGKNLGPFFEAWGVPTSDAARKSIEDLPRWMPED